MQVCCPVCDTAFPIAAGFSEADGKRLAALLAEFDPTLGRAVIGYLALFKPAKTNLRISRAVRLVTDLKALVDLGTVCKDERAGLRRPASPGLWAAGIESMLLQRGSLTLPIENHNYLRAVVFGLADKADADAERQREDQLRQGRRPAAAGATPTNTPQSRYAAALERIAHDERFDLATPAQAEERRAAALAKLRSETE